MRAQSAYSRLTLTNAIALILPLTSLAWVAGCSDEALDDVTTKQSAVFATSYLGVPAYLNTDGGDAAQWNRALQLQGPAILIANGPNSGPPPGPDPVLTNYVSQLRSHGVLVLGYVDWMPGKTLAEVEDDITKWHNAFPQSPSYLGGIFFDDTSRDDDSSLPDVERAIIFSQSLFSFMSSPSTVMFNWGTASTVMEKYVDCSTYYNYLQGPPWATVVQKWVTFEDSESEYMGQTTGLWYDSDHSWVHNYYSGRFVNLIYNAHADGSTLTGLGSIEYVRQQANAEYIYVTDGPYPGNTWGTIASDPLWTRERSVFSGTSDSFAGADLGAETFAYPSWQCPAPSP